MPNKLIFEKSPYLLRHAYNPVDWHPWSDEAFEKAKAEDKPIFLSIGYLSCHWCHVMEKESFENSEIAGLLNEAFVCVKVDREERPDLDRIYMKICQIMTGSGGWPLTVILGPDKKPFFATTYIPKESRFGRVGLKELIPQLVDLWNQQRTQLAVNAEKIVGVLQQKRCESDVFNINKAGKPTLDSAFNFLSGNFDDVNGGFGKAPKFPIPHNLTFLLRYWKRTGNPQSLLMVEKTLNSMRFGGIYDHLGFGFHRYSTDSSWLVPHFEKMLYDQALLILVYVEAYQATGKTEYRRFAREIITYVLRDLTSQEGGFYSAEDADVEGEEGKFYLWTVEEIRNVLDEDEAKFAEQIFNVEEKGNYEDEATGREMGRNILYLKRSLCEIASRLSLPLVKVKKQFERTRRKLFSARKKRVRPRKDDKILTDWNGLMIAALAKAAQAFNEGTYARAAERASNFIVLKMRDAHGRLYHRYRDGDAAISGFLDDYAFLVWGLLELYESTFKVEHLQLAYSLTEEMIEHFWDEEGGGLYFSADDAEEVITRMKETYDGAVPSGNSVAMLNLLRLSRITGETMFEEKVAEMFRSCSSDVSKRPSAYTQLMNALDFAVGPAFEVVVVGDPSSSDTLNMFAALRKTFAPNKVVLFRPAKAELPEIVQFASFVKDLSSREGKATAYVCRNYVCNFPTTNVEGMVELLNVKAQEA